MRYLFVLCILVLLTGCSDTQDMFGAGISNFEYVQPYSNTEGYIVTNYDLKSVSVKDENPLNEFDFSGPMNAYLNRNGQNSTNSTVIEVTDPVVEPSVNPDLPMNATSGYVSPLSPDAGARLTSRFGPRDTGIPGASKYHKGMDFGVKEGSDVYAVNSGTVTKATFSKNRGNYIVIKHDNDVLGNVGSGYLHNKELLVKVGDYVQKGQLIARSGNTGISSGPHLHFELYDSSEKNIDPASFLPTGWAVGF